MIIILKKHTEPQKVNEIIRHFQGLQLEVQGALRRQL